MKQVKQTEVMMTSVKLALGPFGVWVSSGTKFTADHVIVGDEKYSYIGYITLKLLPVVSKDTAGVFKVATILEKVYSFLNPLSDNYKMVKSLLSYKTSDEVVTSLLPLFNYWCYLIDDVSPIIDNALNNTIFNTFKDIPSEWTWDYAGLEGLFPLKLLKITKDDDYHYLSMIGGNSRYEYIVDLFHSVNIRTPGYKKELGSRLGILGTELAYADVAEKANNKHVIKNKDLSELKLLALNVIESSSIPLTQRQKRFVSSVLEISTYMECNKLTAYCNLLIGERK